MNFPCPACAKTFDFNAAPLPSACTRCGCDLTSVTQVLTGAARSASAATEALASQDGPEALYQARRAWELRHSLESAVLGALAAAAHEDLPEVRRWLHRARETADC